MAKVCRILESKDLNRGKYQALAEQAKLLGNIRKEIWQRYGSIRGVGTNHRTIRSEWVQSRDFSPLAAKAWKETLRDTLDDVKLYEEAAKEKVRRAIRQRSLDKDAQKRLYILLKSNQWRKDSFLSRKMRRYRKHGKTKVKNQIIVEFGVYRQFKGKNGNTWIVVPSLVSGHRICIPLNSNMDLTGSLRLILRDGVVYVHHVIESKQHRPCGTEVIGVDKGYSEAFADSDGEFHGVGLGDLLTRGTETRNLRGKSRNKLHQIAKKNLKKQANIQRYNLGRKKLDKTNEHQKKVIRGIAFQAVHSIVDKAKEVRAEDLSSPISSRTRWKKYNRLMSGWAKGSLAEALKSVTKARGSCLRLVNCAYTSQMDSNTHRLEGRRVGDKFHHVNGEVSHADTNAAVNVLDRGDDTEITLYTPYREVKTILLNRLTAIGGVSHSRGDRPSRTPVARGKPISTESELPINLAS